jgi:putative SOS response-associated peptidase YedK
LDRRPRADDHEGDPPERDAMAGVFGLIPHWARDMSIARHAYNARSETVA